MSTSPVSRPRRAPRGREIRPLYSHCKETKENQTMFRPSSALLLLLALASPGAAQAPSPTVWTLAIGDYTIYGTRRIPRPSRCGRGSCSTPPAAWTARAWWTACARQRRRPRPERPRLRGRAQHLADGPVLRRHDVGGDATSRSQGAAGPAPARGAVQRAAGAGAAAADAHGERPADGLVLGGQREAVHRPVRGGAAGGHDQEVPDDDPRPQPGGRLRAACAAGGD